MRDALPVGAVLASALMAANYPGDSGEDVDRLIAELEKRGYRLVSDADDAARSEARRSCCDDRHAHYHGTRWVAARYEAGVDVTIGPIQHSNSQCQKEGCDCWCQACERHNWRHARSETEPKP